MKYDLNKKMTMGARRVLDSFLKALMDLLAEKGFDEITVGELCQRAAYPRATFYNYFDDKYDLLGYCITAITKEINIDDYASINHTKRLYVFFDRFYDIAIENRALMRKIFANDINGLLKSSMQIKLNTIVNQLVRDCDDVDRYPIPYEMVAQHYANTIMLAIEWCLIKEKSCTKEQALGYLEYLLRDI